MIRSYGPNNIAFIYVNSLSYTVSSLEVMYRSYSAKQRKDRLSRSISLFNTFLSSLWTRSQHSAFEYLKLELFVKCSWDFVHDYILKTPKKKKQGDGDGDEDEDDVTMENDDEKSFEPTEEKFCDPFIRLCCGVWSRQLRFCLIRMM